MTDFEFVKGRHIIINTLEKTGSTLLTNILSDITFIQEITLGDRSIDNFNFSLGMARSNREKNLISKTHSLPTIFFMEYLSKNNIRPIILKRDEQQVLSSFHAHLLRRKTISSEIFRSMSEPDQIEYVAQTHLLRIVQFKAIWIVALQKFNIKPIIVDMQQILGASGTSVIHALLKELGIENGWDNQLIERTIESVSKSPRSNHYGTKVIHRYSSAIAEEYKRTFFRKHPNLVHLYNFL